jgi:hypothetical protein
MIVLLALSHLDEVVGLRDRSSSRDLGLVSDSSLRVRHKRSFVRTNFASICYAASGSSCCFGHGINNLRDRPDVHLTE